MNVSTDGRVGCHDVMKMPSVISLLLFMACVAVSCQNVRKATAETLVESVKDPKSGSQVFTRSYDTEPWHQCRGIQKERKSLKKKRVKDTLMDIDFSLNR